MKTVAQPDVLQDLINRLRGLTPTTPRRWGTMSPHEMLCHLGDASDSILGHPGGPPREGRRLVKFIALHTPIPWPKGVKTPAEVDPRREGSRPGDFERDRWRAINGLRALAQASDSALPAGHRRFGPMSRWDWQRWAYRHTDHHLRQFRL
jgi:hypothetical protein